MRQLKVDPEFRDKIPPLSEDEFKKLEENILSDGEVREPIVAWNGTIIDGHNRWKIIQAHPEIPHSVKDMEFPDKWAAVAWMCSNQLGRRNLTDKQKTYLLGKQFEAQKMAHGGTRYSRAQNEPLGKRTAEIIAEEHKVGHMTVKRAEHFAKGLDAAEKASPGFKDAVLTGEIKAHKSKIAEIRNMPDEERRETVQKIKEGRLEKPQQNRAKGPQNGNSKEYREIRESVEAIAADMYNADKPVEYTVNDLVEEIRVNAEVYARQLKRTLVIRSTLLSDENKPVVLGAINRHVFQELEKVVSLLK